MPRFFFNLRADGSYLEDDEGDDCPTLQDAASRAVASAARLLDDPDIMTDSLAGTVVEITDQQRRLKLRIPLDTAARMSHPQSLSPS